MNMTVNKVFGLENLHEPKICFKPPMAFIIFIVNALWRGMSKKYIKKTAVKKPVPQKTWNKLRYFEKHFKIRKLIGTVVVAHGTSKPGYDKISLYYYLRSQMNGTAAEIISFLVYKLNVPELFVVFKLFYMVVAKNEIQRLIKV
jgi:hypothetical protein